LLGRFGFGDRILHEAARLRCIEFGEQPQRLGGRVRTRGVRRLGKARRPEEREQTS